ncbi:L-arabinolactonase [Pseudomonas chlororaphis subsp. aurantiaca]|nr:L-arabinolactonase [Pseudomonas chlororaphis subsp. aurantiaca]
MSWTALTAHRAQLGEGPFWDAPDQALYWVDIAGRQALRLCGERLQAWQLPEPVSAFIPCERGDALVTLSSGVYRLDLGSAPAAPRLSLLCVADPQPGNRANEARCDAQGRLWLGTMQNNIGEQGEDLPVRRRSGGLFRIDTQARVTPLLQGLGIPNTLLWNEDGSRLYLPTAWTARCISTRSPAMAGSNPRTAGSGHTRAASRTVRRWTPRVISGMPAGTAAACSGWRPTARSTGCSNCRSAAPPVACSAARTSRPCTSPARPARSIILWTARCWLSRSIPQGASVIDLPVEVSG